MGFAIAAKVEIACFFHTRYGYRYCNKRLKNMGLHVNSESPTEIFLGSVYGSSCYNSASPTEISGVHRRFPVARLAKSHTEIRSDSDGFNIDARCWYSLHFLKPSMGYAIVADYGFNCILKPSMGFAIVADYGFNCILNPSMGFAIVLND